MKTILKPDGTEIELDVPTSMSPTLEDRVSSLETNQDLIVDAINSWTKILGVLVANSNQIYPQIDLDYQDNAIHIRAPKEIIHSTSIVLLLPTETLDLNSEIKNKPTLVIHFANKELTLSIVKEDYNGNIVDLKTGDIVANRLCVLRFDNTTNDRVILCHSLSFDSMSVNHLVCNDAIFNSFPRVKTDNNTYDVLLSAKTKADLFDELNKTYQKKIVFGTESPEDYIKTHYLEEGQLYIQQGE